MEAQKCEVCENEFARIKCHDCTKLSYFCDSCYAVSHSVDTKRAHKIEVVNQIKTIDKEIGSDSKSKVPCPKHNDHSCNMFCITCQKSLCNVCASSKDHNSHKLEAISNVQKELGNRMNNMIKKCNENLKHLENITNNSSNIQAHIKTELKNSKIFLEEYFEKLHSILKAKKEEFLQQIEKGNEPNLKNLLSINFILKFLMIKLINKIKYYESIKMSLNILTRINENSQILFKEINELNSIEKTIADYECQVNFFTNKRFAFSSINFNEFESSIKNMMLFSYQDLKIIDNNNEKLILGKDYIC